mmetsp:Transcript_14479/g.16424  ORF Transcript_14479/g.16424 Transcript_14479/m.16424 type:complete len:94 (+) Transcript_14479:1145-1426(+)
MYSCKLVLKKVLPSASDFCFLFQLSLVLVLFCFGFGYVDVWFVFVWNISVNSFGCWHLLLDIESKIMLQLANCRGRATTLIRTRTLDTTSTKG